MVYGLVKKSQKLSRNLLWFSKMWTTLNDEFSIESKGARPTPVYSPLFLTLPFAKILMSNVKSIVGGAGEDDY